MPAFSKDTEPWARHIRLFTRAIPVPPAPPQAAWDDADTLQQLPGVGPAQAARLRSRGVATLHDLVLGGEQSAKRLLENCGLSSANGSAAGSRARGGERTHNGDRGGVGAALRALAAIPVVKDVSLVVRPAESSGTGEVSVRAVISFFMRCLLASSFHP